MNREGQEMRKVEILAVGEACKAIYSGLHQTGKGNRAFDSSGFFRRGDFFFFFLRLQYPKADSPSL